MKDACKRGSALSRGQQAGPYSYRHEVGSGVAVVVTEFTARLTARLITVLDQARTFFMRLGGHGMAVHTPAEPGKEYAQGQQFADCLLHNDDLNMQKKPMQIAGQF